jgi:hypothetical protein
LARPTTFVPRLATASARHAAGQLTVTLSVRPRSLADASFAFGVGWTVGCGVGSGVAAAPGSAGPQSGSLPPAITSFGATPQTGEV